MRKRKIKEIDKGWKDIKSLAKRADRSYTKVGVQQGTTHKNTDPGSKSEQLSDLVMIAAVNEFGTKDGKIPSRPALRLAVENNSKKIAKLSATVYSKTLDKSITLEQALSILGEFVTDAMKKSITDLKTPPNSPRTIAAKGSSNPLIDTGQYRNSISHIEVIK